MGDRANIKVVDGPDNQIWLYSHWGGEELPGILHAALCKHQRWQDTAYLTRIIFCQMVKGSEEDETGFGISSQMGDNEHLILVVDCDKQAISLDQEDGKTVFQPISFEEFVKNPHKLFKAYQNRD